MKKLTRCPDQFFFAPVTQQSSFFFLRDCPEMIWFLSMIPMSCFAGEADALLLLFCRRRGVVGDRIPA